MFTAIISSKKYWISARILAVGFIFLYSVVEHFMEYQNFAISTFIDERISNGRWIRYAISRIVGGFLYGTIMAYFFEARKRKLRQ